MKCTAHLCRLSLTFARRRQGKGWECRGESTGTSGHSAHKTRLNSAPGIFAYITRAVPEIKLHSTSARAALHVPGNAQNACRKSQSRSGARTTQQVLHALVRCTTVSRHDRPVVFGRSDAPARGIRCRRRRQELTHGSRGSAMVPRCLSPGAYQPGMTSAEPGAVATPGPLAQNLRASPPLPASRDRDPTGLLGACDCVSVLAKKILLVLLNNIPNGVIFKQSSKTEEKGAPKL